MKQAQRTFYVRRLSNLAGETTCYVVTDQPPGSNDSKHPMFAKFPVNELYDETKQLGNAGIVAYVANGMLRLEKTPKYHEEVARLQAQASQVKSTQLEQIELLEQLDKKADASLAAADVMRDVLRKAAAVDEKKPVSIWKRLFKKD